VAKFWLILYRKGRKGAELQESLFSYSSALIIGKYKNYDTFPTDIDKDSFVSIRQNAFKKGKLLWVTFFPQRPNISAELAGKVCQELATLLI
jgi:hypothetical protein